MRAVTAAQRLLARTIVAAWRRYSRTANADGLALFLREQRSATPLDFPNTVREADLLRAMAVFATHVHTESVYECANNCLIEPTHGYIATRELQLVEQSFAYAHLLDRVSARMLYPFLRARRKTASPDLELAVSLRDPNEGNYWHFFDDILSKLVLVDRMSLPANVPLLVGERLWNTPFFQRAITCDALRHRNFMLHDDTLCVKRLIWCVKGSLKRENLDFAVDALRPTAPRHDFQAPPADRRIYLRRAKSRGRSVTNRAEVEALLREYDFELIDADDLGLDEQIALFANARYVVGIHGAGLVNLMFRRGYPLDVLELFPADFLHPHYVWLCHVYGFGYRELVCGPSAMDRSFAVDVSALRAQLDDLLGHTFA